ncbi:MAG: hypothetical protein HDS15_05675 [Bacteroides sp.]|nr:hypothetical protein [Bacteroides sp.]
MSDSRNNGKKKVAPWLIIGVLVLIALLLIWLTVADMFGDTDVAAQLLDCAGKTVSSFGLPVA